MKNALLCGFFVLLSTTGLIKAAGEPKSNCNCAAKPQQSKADFPSGKFIHYDDIMRGFKGGAEMVKVIVNLAEPAERDATDWKSKQSLKVLHEKVAKSQEAVLTCLNKSEFRLRHRLENQTSFSGEVTLEGLEKLKNNPNVVSIEPVYVFKPQLRQGIPLIHADTYRSTYGGEGTAIAICDTGVDYRHPMLGNGGFPNSKVIGGYDFGDFDSDPMPHSTQAHGTCCAGIAAGSFGDTGDYIGGVAYNAKLYALKITSGSGGSSFSDTIASAWDWCITHKYDDPNHPIVAISTSFGGGRYYSYCDGYESALATAANNASAAGITLTVSSGNDGYCDSIASPACLSSVISVGAVYDASIGTYYPCVNSESCVTKYPDGCLTGYYTIDNTYADRVTSYSNTASFLTILAPSNSCYTADIVGSGGYSSGDYFSDFGGTSAACPYAAGAVACLQSAAKSCTGSFLTADQVKTVLTSTGNNVTDPKVAITKPRINLAQAIENICEIGPPPVYCSASGNTCDEYISGVAVGTINNTGTACSHYADYTAISTDIGRCQSYQITVTNGKSYSSDQCGIWVDWNRDYDFDDAGENINVSGSPGRGPYTAIIMAPAEVALGNTRMRIRITYTGTVSPCGNTTYGEVEDYTLNIAEGNCQCTARKGDGFESGDFSVLPWSTSGNANWAITSADKSSGTYSARAGTIGNNQSTSLEFTFEVASGNITFYRKVSSESGYDWLRFYIDGVQQGQWSGEQEWAQFAYSVAAGSRTFKWTYSKDYSISRGSDTAWIDDITFPVAIPCVVIGDFDEDGDVDIDDLGIFCTNWLTDNALTDIAPLPDGDGTVDMQDFAIFAQHWLDGTSP